MADRRRDGERFGRRRVRAAREALRSGWRDSGCYPPVTIADAIETGAANSPDDLMIFSAVDGDEHAATLSEIQRAALRLAGRLAAAASVQVTR